MIRVLLADDNPVIRSGLASLLALEPDLEVVGEAANGREALSMARERHPDVVLLDVRMPLMDGLEAAGELAGNRRVLMLTYAEDAAIVTAAIKAGASGYLVHGRFTPAELADAVRAVHAGHNVVSPAVAPVLFEALRGEGDAAAVVATPAGDRGLTEREAEVLNLMAKGLSNSEIAGELFLSAKTVKNHINRAFAKLGVTSRAAAIAAWLGTDGRPHAGRSLAGPW